MELAVNKKTLSSVYDDKSFLNETVNLLNSIIDEELEKEVPDCDLIDECISTLDLIQTAENPTLALHLVLSKKEVINYCRKNAKSKNLKKSVAAAMILVIIGSSAVFTLSPKAVKSAQSFFESISAFLFEKADETESGDDKISSIYATFPEGTAFKTKTANNITLENVVITAIYNDSKTKEIPLSDCQISKTEEKDGEKKYVLVVISYKGCACSVVYEMEE
ncbi:MAG: hypothetical protein IKR97_06530 [Eubacterium sp.]|nr:hypothetical protein [Eubacterium sp.]